MTLFVNIVVGQCRGVGLVGLTKQKIAMADNCVIYKH